MTDTGQTPGAGPSVCPFVALAEDRNRRADDPDKGNRCYAEPAPRQRDLAYQADYCYAKTFASCSVFLAWAARNAAEPAYVTEAAQHAWGSGIAAPEGDASTAGAEATAGEGSSTPSVEGGLFGPPQPGESGGDAESGPASLDWVSASAWADAPWDERAEVEAEELATIEETEPDDGFDADDEGADTDRDEEATTAPKVPAALPMRRRRGRQRPIRSRGSGEWFYANPLDHEPLVKRRYGITPPILLAVLGLLVVALVAFLLPTLLSGGDDSRVAAAPSASPGASGRPAATRRPVVATKASPTEEPSPTPPPKPKFYKVKAGDSLTGIAQRFGVDPQHLQCLNGIKDKNVVVLGARYQIPPEGFSCWPGWRRGATPPP